MMGTDDDCLGLRAVTAPASGNVSYHNAYPGGYIDHVINVCKAAKGVDLVYRSMGAEIDYTMDELMFTALNHDLGKLGDLVGPAYEPQTSEWHRKNQGKVYQHNPNIHYMGVTDRSIWLLNQFDIKYSQVEFIGIRVSDGMYDEANHQYLKPFSVDANLKTQLPVVIHMADYLSSKREGQWNKKVLAEWEKQGVKY